MPKNVSTTQLTGLALEIQQALSSLKKDTENITDILNNIKLQCYTLDLYNGTKVAGSTRNNQVSYQDGKETKTYTMKHWATWKIEGQNELRSQCSSLEHQVDEVESTISTLNLEAEDIQVIADTIEQYIQSMEGELKNNIGVDLKTAFDWITGKMVYAATNSAELGGMGIPRYYQGDYDNVILQGDKTVASSGCGFTSASMVASYLTGKDITPDKFVDDWSRPYYIYNGGMSWGLPAATAQHYNLGTVEATTDPNRVIEALKNNQPVMCSQGKGLFTNEGHIILLSGLDSDGKVIVNDPNADNAINKGYNNRSFDINSEINPTARQYWIFEAKK